MSEYQREQLETYAEIQRHLAMLSRQEKDRLCATAESYLAFRKDVDAFQAEHFGDICTRNCYESRLSACCSREGIVIFFADMLINALLSQEEDIQALMSVLQKENKGFKCVYLGKQGCLWRLKPIVCEMFLCGQAEKEVFGKNPSAGETWEELNRRKKRYTWPDRPVLFDTLEEYFLQKGYSSPLMYMHHSPGLLRLKRRSRAQATV